MSVKSDRRTDGFELVIIFKKNLYIYIGSHHYRALHFKILQSYNVSYYIRSFKTDLTVDIKTPQF